MEHPDNLVDLYLLTLVVEADGFSAAARRAGTTKSRLSRRLIQLEKRLGVQLLQRNARRFCVTLVGEQMYRQAVLMREAAETAETLAHDTQSSSRGHIRVHANSMLMPLLEGLLDGFRHCHPDTHLHATLGENGIEALLAQQTDAAMHMADALPDSTDIVAHVLGSARMVTVVSPALLRRTGVPEKPQQIPDQHRLDYVNTAPSRPQHNPAPGTSAPGFASNHAPTLLSAARAGMGYAQLPLYLCHDALQEGLLVAPFDAHESPPQPLHVLTLRERAASKATRSFVRFARRHLVQLPGVTTVERSNEDRAAE